MKCYEFQRYFLDKNSQKFVKQRKTNLENSVCKEIKTTQHMHNFGKHIYMSCKVSARKEFRPNIPHIALDEKESWSKEWHEEYTKKDHVEDVQWKYPSAVPNRKESKMIVARVAEIGNG